MKQFKAKLFKLGNSMAVYIPKEVYTGLEDSKVYTFIVEDFKNDKPVYTDQEVRKPTNPPSKRLVFNIKTGQNEWK